ncbi:MAG: hypothetical protein IAI48_00655 [Candidatus Eremiobacteraeota bacterium]|nr:hypothetical protein [Candidatus Eremiobacteraeota bacterium]
MIRGNFGDFLDSPGVTAHVRANAAVQMLRMALVSGDPEKREEFLAQSFARIADVIGIETFINAVRIGAEITLDP